MEESTSREKVLKRVRNALIYKTDNPFAQVEFDSPVYTAMDESLDVNFAQEFTKAGGQFVYCEDETDLVQSLASLASENDWQDVFCMDPSIQYYLTQAGIPFQSDDESFHDLKVGITSCEFLISRLGSIMISSKQDSGRRLNVYPEIHIVIAYPSQLVPDLKDALALIREKYGNRIPSLVSVITGPSRTADIEKTLVMGAHGPKELYVFLTEVPENEAEDE
ncbi:MAG: lactate utilization protein [Bacteroidetes bacterium]|nr:lactate utilization protein [Bacteroidota bacterium]